MPAEGVGVKKCREGKEDDSAGAGIIEKRSDIKGVGGGELSVWFVMRSLKRCDVPSGWGVSSLRCFVGSCVVRPTF